MRSNRKLLLGIALILTAVIFWRVLVTLNGASKPPAVATVPETGAPVVPVVAAGRILRATQNIPTGSIIAPGMYESVAPSPGQNSSGLITDEKFALGYITRTALNKGAFIRPEDFVGHITEVGVAGALRPGTRAQTIAIANRPTLHDLVKIGNYVDIYAAFEGQEARAVVQNVRVLVVDVFVNDYPPVNGAMRGAYKAAPKGNLPVGAPTPVPGAPAPTPTPEPPPAAAPSPALTLEVTPSQAASLLLMQASGATFDFLLRPVTAQGGEALVPGGSVEEDLTPVSVTRPQISPYAERMKRAAAQSNRPPGGSGGSGGSGGRNFTPPPPIQAGLPPQGLGGLPPGPPQTQVVTVPAPPPATYEIPIYADGKMVRSDTVRRP